MKWKELSELDSCSSLAATVLSRNRDLSKRDRNRSFSTSAPADSLVMHSQWNRTERGTLINNMYELLFLKMIPRSLIKQTIMRKYAYSSFKMFMRWSENKNNKTVRHRCSRVDF